MKGIMKLIYSL